MVQEESTALEVINNNIGSVDYTTGKVTINQINVAAYAGDGITVSAVPVDVTLGSTRNIILQYNSTPDITVIQERV